VSELLPGAAEALVYAGAVFVLNATPGVDLLLTVSRTLAGGVRAGVAAAVGISSGCVVHALAAAFGLAALLALHPGTFRLIQWAGAAYLAWLGIGMLRSAAARPADAALPGAHADRVAPASDWADFRTGFLTNLLNPKVALFFLAFIPQFVPAASPDKTLSFLLLGGWFVAQGTLFLLALVALAARLARLPSSQAARRWLGAAGGGLFILLAARLVLAERPGAAP
jgi:threonine/homoserine/homoserine lactone efflux protein